MSRWWPLLAGLAGRPGRGAAGRPGLPGGLPPARSVQRSDPGAQRHAGTGSAALVSIWSRNDTTVIPPDSARLPGAVNIEAQQVCPTETVSHSGLPVDPLVAGMVLAALDGRPWTVAPAAASCATLRALG